jgi:hypothetical protein
LTECEARDIKPHLAAVKAEITDAVLDKPIADRPAIVKRIVQKHRPGGFGVGSRAGLLGEVPSVGVT